MWFDKVKFLNGALWWTMSAKPTIIITTNLQTLGGNNYVPFLLIIVSLHFTCGKKNNWWNINKFQNDHGIWLKSGTVINKGFTWPTHLTHSNKYISTQNISYTNPKKQFSSENVFDTCLKELILYPKKNFLVLTQQNIQFSKRKTFSDFSRKKKQTKRKNFLFLSEKLIPYICVKKLMCFISEVFWIRLHYFLCCQTLINQWER